MPGAPRHQRRDMKRVIKADQLRMMEDNLEQIFHDRMKRVGVCSLSEEWDNILLWSHYADAHGGVCLRFTATPEDRDFYLAFKVEYSTERPVINVMDRDANEWVSKSLLTKAHIWEYEKEWRMFDVDGPGVHPFRPRLLDAVILGARITAENRRLISEWLFLRGEPVMLTQAQFAPREFKLELVRPA